MSEDFGEGAFSFRYFGKQFPLVKYLSEKFPLKTFSDDPVEGWTERIRRGQVQVYDHFVGIRYHLKNLDRVSFLPVVSEPAVDRIVRVIHEDAELLVVDKPANLPVHPSGAYRLNSLIHILEESHGRLHPVHRLDRETSGVMILAKYPEAARLIAQSFHLNEKTYLAAVGGVFQGTKWVDFPLGQKRGSLIRIKQGFHPDGQSARTRFRAVCHKKGHTLLFAKPVTGRRHQIRAHLAEIGYPVLGDKIYGPDESHFLRFVETGWDSKMNLALGLDRHFLHCWKIRFRNPILRKVQVFKSPLPPALCQTWNKLP